MMNLSSFLLMLKGGVGSGNFDHAGRPGEHGGSASKSSITNPSSFSELYTQVRKNGKAKKEEFVTGFFDSSSKQFVFSSKFEKQHVDITKDDKLLDKSVRFYVNFDKGKVQSLMFDAQKAGISTQNEKKAVDSIYKVLDRMKALADDPKSVKVKILNYPGKPSINTTLG